MKSPGTPGVDESLWKEVSDMMRGRRGARGGMMRGGLMRGGPMARIWKRTEAGAETVSYSSIFGKSVYLFLIVVLGFTFNYLLFFQGTTFGGTDVPAGYVLTLAMLPVYLITAIIASRRSSPITSTLAVAAQGVLIGGLSALYAAQLGDHLIGTAVLATFAVFFSMLLLYRTRVIRVTAAFQKVMFTALIGLILMSLVFFVLFLIGGWGFFGGTPIALYALIVIGGVVISALFLNISFNQIEEAVNAGADKRFEWMLSFGLILTLVWLYIELLRLIAIIASFTSNR